jgi:CBS domain-containing protein
VTINVDASVDNGLFLMREKGVRHLSVMDNGAVVL